MIGNWFAQRRWRRSKNLTGGERLVIDALLAGPGHDLRCLAMQVEKAVHFEREMVGTAAYALRIPWTTEDLLIGADEDIESVPAHVTDAVSRRELRFKLQVKRGGFFGPLLGEAVDGGAWPLSWEAASPSRVRIAGTPPFLPLPSDEARRKQLLAGTARLAAWLGQPLNEEEAAHLRPRLPATEEQLAHLMGQAGGKPSGSYVAFLRVTNGLDVGSLQVLGTHDAYPLVIEDRLLLVIASLGEEGVIAIPLDGGEEVLHCQAAGKHTTDSRRLAPDMAAFVREALKEPRGASA